MTRRQRILRRWFVGYVIVLFATLPLALPAWNAWLGKASVAWLTVERFHIAQYAGLGGLAVLYARAGTRPIGTLCLLVAVIAGIGFCDELVQLYLPGRYFDWADVGLNVLGGLIGIVAVGALSFLVQGMPSRALVSQKTQSS